MTISRDRINRTMYVSQPGYIDKVLDCFEVQYCKPTTPMSSTYHTARLTDTDILLLSNIGQFQYFVGSLLYINVLIYYTLLLVLHDIQSLLSLVTVAATRVLRYLKLNCNLALVFHSV